MKADTLRLAPRLWRPHGIARDADDAMPFAEQIQRLCGLFREADDAGRVAAHDMSQPEIGPDEGFAGDGLARFEIERVREHRSGGDAGVELAVLAARDRRWRAGRSEGSDRTLARRSGGRARGCRCTASRACNPFSIISSARRARRHGPTRETAARARVREPFLPVAPDVLEEQVAECDMSEAVGDGFGNRRGHARLVHLVRARVRDWDNAKRQSGHARLCGKDVAANRMHGDAIDRFVDRRQQCADGARDAFVAERAAPTRCPCPSSTKAGSSFERLGMKCVRERLSRHRQPAGLERRGSRR